jgi:hypothetical protein
MQAVCSNVSQRIFDNPSVQCQVAVLVRTNRPELLRNYLSKLRAVTAALAAGSGCKWVIDEIRGGLAVAALEAAPRMWTTELASRTSTTREILIVPYAVLRVAFVEFVLWSLTPTGEI